MKTFEDFKNYLGRLKPRERTISLNHPNAWFRGNNAMAMNIHGYWHLLFHLQRISKPDSVILDVGAYPGIVPQLVREFLGFKDPLKYIALGIGFTSDFKEEMKVYDCQLLEADLDPRISGHLGRNRRIDLEEESTDIVILKDVIEHFFDPFYPLLEINRVLKTGGTLFLSTDNLTRFEGLMNFIKGRSCNVPLIEGNLFYDGDWRPHFREYSKNELEELLSWAGFEVENHEYFEAEFGFYKSNGQRLERFDYTQIGLKNKLKGLLRNLAKFFFPQLKDNHFIVAKKVHSFSDTIEKAPKLCTDFEEWMMQRSQF